MHNDLGFISFLLFLHLPFTWWVLWAWCQVWGQDDGWGSWVLCWLLSGPQTPGRTPDSKRRILRILNACEAHTWIWDWMCCFLKAGCGAAVCVATWKKQEAYVLPCCVSTVGHLCSRLLQDSGVFIFLGHILYCCSRISLLSLSSPFLWHRRAEHCWTNSWAAVWNITVAQ